MTTSEAPSRQIVSVSLPAGTAEALRLRARRADWTVSHTARRLLTEALRNAESGDATTGQDSHHDGAT